jgi:flagellar biosynthesis/type III secretory pathway protein FliH
MTLYLAARYSFPTPDELRSYREPERLLERAAELDREKAAAARRGYEEGLAEGRAAAESELSAAREAARKEGFEAGAAEGREQAGRTAAALEQALEEIRLAREGFADEAESFAVALALAIVERMVEIDSVRADFVAAAAANAVRALAPEQPSAIHMNPADRAILQDKVSGLPVRDDPSLAPGHVRVEAGRLLVQSGIDEAFAQIKAAIMETRARRKGAKRR